MRCIDQYDKNATMRSTNGTMVPLAAEIVQGFLVTIGKNGTNSTIGRFTDFTIGRTPNVASVHGFTNGTIGNAIGNAIGTNGTNVTNIRQQMVQRAFVVFSNGKNGTIGRLIPFKVLPMVPLVMPLVPMVPMLPTYGSKWCRQNTAWVILPTREKSHDSISRA